MKRNRNNSLFDRTLLRQSLRASFQKLDPRKMVKNPIMFTVEAVTFVMLLLIVWIAVTGNTSQGSLLYNVVVFLVLFATVLFANFAEAIAEARGKAQADSLRKTREETPAKRIDPDGQSHIVSSSDLRQGDLFECVAGDTVAADGEIVEGLASIDESAITGESAPVIREAGGDKSSVTGGTKVLSDRILVKVTARPGESFLDKMIALVEGSSRQKTPNEIALTILLAGFTIVFVIVCATLKPFADYVGANITVAAFISLFVCLIPTTIGGLLSAIGIAGMDRALRANVITKSGKVVDKPCETCGGQGRTPSRETVEVKVPAGVHSGQTIRVAGKGEAGVRGDASGDLVVSIEVAQDERFERQGDDLYTTVRVDALQAILGTTVTVDGIMKGERVKVEIPAGCQYGQQIKVERRGMPRQGMISRGSLIAVVQVVVPTDLDKRQLLDIAGIVAERTLGEEGNDSGRDARAEEEGDSPARDEEAEHLAGERWTAPKNPFKDAKRKPRSRGKGGRR